MRVRRLPVLAVVLGVAAAVGLPSVAPPAAAAPGDSGWSAYLHGPRHSSDAATSTVVTAGNASSLAVAWRWTPTPKPGVTAMLNASPVTLNGTVYVNAGNGDLYALDEATGAVRWRRILPTAPCGKRGSTSTPTVIRDPADGVLTVYVAGADNYLYALNAASGATRWRTVNGGLDNSFYTWGSPTLADGKVYLAVSSSPCAEFSHGGLAAYNQHTGALLGTYRTATAGQIPTVYTSALVGGSDVYVTTGDGSQGDSDSVVRLRAGDLARQEAWQIPTPPDNSDFNASPAFFTRNGVDMVGVCNKDGNYYALRAGNLSAGPVWTTRVGLNSQAQPGQLRFCGGSSAYDSSRGVLLVGSNQRSLADSALGSVYSVNPQDGAVRWRTSLPTGPVLGSVSVNGAGVVAAPTYNTNGTGKVYVLNETTGKILKVLPGAGPVFAQPVFSGNHLLVAAASMLTAWAP